MGIPVPSTGSVTEDVAVSGSGYLTANGDINFWLGSDAGAWTAGTFTGSYGSLTINSNGVWSYQALNSQASIQALDTGDSLTEVFNVSSTGGNSTVTITIHGTDEPPCFTRGTPIETPRGPRPVEDLRVGDMVLTLDDGPQPIRWIGSRRMALLAGDEALRPVMLRKGAIGPGIPARDLVVSPMHRLLLGGASAQLLFGQDEVLCPAVHLVNDHTILPQPAPEVEYFHLLFDRHQIVFSLNCASESFYPGGVGLDGFDAAARDEVFALFPELRSLPGRYGNLARATLKRHEAGLLRDLLAPAPLDITRPPWAA